MVFEVIDLSQDSSQELDSATINARLDAERSALISMFRSRKQGSAEDRRTTFANKQHEAPSSVVIPTPRVAQMLELPLAPPTSPNTGPVTGQRAHSRMPSGWSETKTIVSDTTPSVNGHNTTARSITPGTHGPEMISSGMHQEPRFKRTADGQMKVSSPLTSVRAEEVRSHPLDGEIQAYRDNLLRTHPFLNNHKLPTGETLLGNDTTRSLVIAMIHQIEPRQKGRCKAEEDLLIHLKRELGVAWKNMVPYYFPHVNKWHQLQSHYSTKLTPRDPAKRSIKTQETRSPKSLVKSKRMPQELNDIHEPSEIRKSARRRRKRQEDDSFVDWRCVDLDDNETHSVHDEKNVDSEDILSLSALSCRPTTLSTPTHVPSNKIYQDVSGHRDGRKASVKFVEPFPLENIRDTPSKMQTPISQTFKQNRVSSTASIQGALQRRELGFNLGSRANRSETLKSALAKTLGPNLRFREASGDVQTVAWSTDGTQFAAGAAALTDDHSMQYNRPNNLLLGDMGTKQLHELPNHYKYRQLTDSGPNSQFEMYVAEGPLLYQSISAVAYTADGHTLLSASYDNSVLAWDPNARCVAEFPHGAPVDLLAVNSRGLFATGAQCLDKSIRVLQHKTSTEPLSMLASHCALERPERRIFPSCLRWGNTIYDQERYLLAGFSSFSDNGSGALCLWDLNKEQAVFDRPSHEVFDVAWCPSIFGRFAVGLRAQPNSVNRGTRSVIKIFDSRYDTHTLDTFVSSQRTIELECPAADMNDITFNPSNDRLISTSCTDGATYLWDIRQPDKMLHRFQHSKTTTETFAQDLDTGVRFVSWDESHRRLYTGSSDGVVALWDPYVSGVDTHVRDVIQLPSGVMSGAFSPDYANLLLGEVNGTISVLSTNGDKNTGFKDFTFNPAKEEKEKLKLKALQSLSSPIADRLKEESAADISRRALQSYSLTVVPFRDHPRGQVVQKPHPDSAELNGGEGQCELDHQVAYFTAEEEGDSGVSIYRIPEHFRFSTSKTSISDDNDDHETSHKLRYPLKVEPHSRKISTIDLACFRCGDRPMKADFDQERAYVACEECLSLWFVDCLGYYESHEMKKAQVRKTQRINAQLPSDSAFDRLAISMLSDKEKRALSSGSSKARRKEYRLDRELLRDLDMLDLGCSDEYYQSFWQD